MDRDNVNYNFDIRYPFTKPYHVQNFHMCNKNLLPSTNYPVVLQSRPYKLRPGFCAERLGPLNRCTDRTVNDKLGKDPDGT